MVSVNIVVVVFEKNIYSIFVALKIGYDPEEIQYLDQYGNGGAYEQQQQHAHNSSNMSAYYTSPLDRARPGSLHTSSTLGYGRPVRPGPVLGSVAPIEQAPQTHRRLPLLGSFVV